MTDPTRPTGHAAGGVDEATDPPPDQLNVEPPVDVLAGDWPGPDDEARTDPPASAASHDPPPGQPLTTDEHGDAAPWPGTRRKLGGRYTLEEAIATGGAAIVWRAFDEQLSRSVAIKIVHPHLIVDTTTVERFKRESRAAAQLTHTNAVRIYDTGHEDDIVYLVMEFVDGLSLRDVLRQHRQLDPLVVAALGEQVASALGEAHQMGMVHRDVKPGNILLTAEGVPKVTDFGIAKARHGHDPTLTQQGTVVGTAAYVSPEQLEGKEVDARADVYALGVVLHECLTGRPAFHGDTPTATAAARLTQEVLPPRQLRADVPRALDDIVVRATRRSPEQRYPDGAVLAAMLTPLVPTKPSEATAVLVGGSPSVDGAETFLASDRERQQTTGQAVTAGASGRRAFLAFLGGLALAGIALVAAMALRQTPVETAPVAPVTIHPVVGSAVFDPWGDGNEHNEQVPQAIDGSLTTAWTTETYRDGPAFDGTKPGVGIYLDLGEPRQVHGLVFDLVRGGLDVEVYAVNRLPDEVDRLVGWGQPIAQLNDMAVNYRFALPTPTTARYWLLWVTELTTVGDGTYQAAVAEVTVVGP